MVQMLLKKEKNQSLSVFMLAEAMLLQLCTAIE